jgi:2-hydroxychromene-2-carboxylate isomerase
MKVSWVFDVISPFSYLSLRQLSQLPAGTEVELVPVLFASLLNHTGLVGPAEIPSKRLFTYRTCLWRAQRLGVEMRFPPSHPFNPLMALRLIVAAGTTLEATQAVFDAVWRDGRDVSEPQVIADLARRLGIAEVGQALADPAVKHKLLANGTWAIAREVFGVPSFVIGKEVFWGHDSFEMALDYLRDPQLFESAEMRRIASLPVGVARRPRPATAS